MVSVTSCPHLCGFWCDFQQAKVAMCTWKAFLSLQVGSSKSNIKVLVNSNKALTFSTWEGPQVTFLKTLICKYINSGTEIKTFKSFPFLLRYAEIVVFRVGEEDMEIIQTCRRRWEK